MYVCMCVSVYVCMNVCVALHPIPRRDDQLEPPSQFTSASTSGGKSVMFGGGTGYGGGERGASGMNQVPLISTHLQDGFSVAMLLPSCVYVHPVGVFVEWRVTIRSVCVYVCGEKACKMLPCCSLICHFTTTDHLWTTAQLKLKNSSWIYLFLFIYVWV